MADKVFNMLEQMYAEMQNGFNKINAEIQEVKTDIKDLKEDVNSLKKQVSVIEVEHGKKLSVLFDGYTQNTKLLEDIREEVAKHEEVIIKRVK